MAPAARSWSASTAPTEPGPHCTTPSRKRPVAARRAAGEPVPAGPVDVLGVAGPPADVLVDAAGDADLLVVGHRGRGARHGRLTGPVAIGCVLRARCPVTVLLPPGPDTA
nr:universal stress protein [Actinomycetospora sp. NBRC 106375]